MDISPGWLRDAGRDLITRGEHMSRIVTSPDRATRLLRQSAWSWIAGDVDPETWIVQSTETGPHATTTRNLPWEAVVRFDWASDPSSPYIGRPATDTARDTASLAAAVELSLAREAGGDIAKILAVPQAAEGADTTGDVDNDDAQSDPMEDLRKDLGAAKGRTLLTESTSNNYDLGGRPPPGRHEAGTGSAPTRPPRKWPSPLTLTCGCSTPCACRCPWSLTLMAPDSARR